MSPLVSRVLPSFAIAALVGGLVGACSGKTNRPSDPCGDQPCPAGTHKLNSAKEQVGAAEVNGEVKTFGSGECQFTCKAISHCPEGMFPVMTQECFSCGKVVEGKAVVGECRAVQPAQPNGSGGNEGGQGEGEGLWAGGEWHDPEAWVEVDPSELAPGLFEGGDEGEGEWGDLCCDDYGEPACELYEPAPLDSECLCEGLGYGFTC